ncbi:MAG: glycosyltransferase family 39 protein [Planctomycetes bacterium]|nr:glycosyltransferase family 39 protein [Planctomycetota bacterium]
MLKKILSEKNILIFILFVAVFLRFSSLAVFMYKNDIAISENGLSAYPIGDDSQIYYNTAKNLVEGKGYSITTTEIYQELPVFFKSTGIPDTYFQNFYPPVYSVFLSILYRIFGTSILVYAIPQIILGSATCYLVYVIARSAFSSKIGLLACFLLAIYHPLIWWTSYIRAETLFIFLLLLAIVFLTKAVRKNLDLKYIIFSGIALGMSCLCRTVVMYLPVFVVPYFAILFFKKDKKRLFLSTAVFLLAFCITLAPWSYRNHNIFKTYSVTSSDAWATFYGCNVMSPDLPFFDLYEIKFPDEKTDILLPGGEKAASIAFVKDRPLTYAKLCLKRFITFWGPITKKPSLIKKVADTFIYIIVFPMAFYGFYKSKWWVNAGAGLRPAPALLITVILYYTILHSAVGVDDALIYRYPIIPLICIFSAYGYYAYFRSYPSNSTKGNV